MKLNSIWRLTLVLLIVWQLLPFGVYAQQDKAEAAIQEIIDKGRAVGLSVAVVKDNQLLYSNAFGLKDRETGAPLTTKEIFRIASISKSFSATAVMQLVKTGKLSLKDDVSD
ncbi:MAG TPA: serine hydrolase domain-containing protein, partial [Flavihumibacter sp.]